MSNQTPFTGVEYQKGFGGHIESEAIKGALPQGQNSPQVCPLGLYAEQLSGTAFTVGRPLNQRSWLYRIKPSVCHAELKKIASPKGYVNAENCTVEAKQLRWDPLNQLLKVGSSQQDFIGGLHTFACSGHPVDRHGLMVYYYNANVGMANKAFSNSDGDFLIVPHQGCLQVKTEFGLFQVEPLEIVVIPKGMRFQINADSADNISGYILEVYDGHFELPDLGPIGANGLVNPQDIQFPEPSMMKILPTPSLRLPSSLVGSFTNNNRIGALLMSWPGRVITFPSSMT